jgi:Pyruvate/2-oxoacid:ferredoxin oxidoreductase delta subunit
MGHRVGKDLYRELHRKIDGLSMRAPWNKTFHSIVKELFSEEEADVIVKMPYGLSPLKRIASLSGKNEKKLSQLLNGLANKGLVIDILRGDTAYYMPSPMVIGIFEFTMMRAGNDFDQKKMAKLFHEYLSSDDSFVAANMSGGNTFSVMRTVPYEEGFRPEDAVEVLDYEKARTIIENTQRFGIGICSCRHEKQHVDEQKCEVPLDNCTSFGLSADYLVRNRLAREATKSEILDNLARSREFGLVMSADNVQRNVQFMCHCCGCCCNYLAGLTKWGYTEAVITSSYLAIPDDSKCNGCKMCSIACPIKAIKMEELTPPEPKRKSKPIVNENWCIGCGVCSLKCKTKSMHLVPRKQRTITPEDMFEKNILQTLEKGNLQNMIFDNPNSISQDFMRSLVGGFLRLSPVKKALVSKALRSRFLSAMKSGVKSQGKGWLTEM